MAFIGDSFFIEGPGGQVSTDVFNHRLPWNEFHDTARVPKGVLFYLKRKGRIASGRAIRSKWKNLPGKTEHSVNSIKEKRVRGLRYSVPGRVPVIVFWPKTRVKDRRLKVQTGEESIHGASCCCAFGQTRKSVCLNISIPFAFSHF